MVKINLIDEFCKRLTRDNEIGEFGIKNSSAERLRPEEDDLDIRPPFFRDVDRIGHSLSFSRYIDKSQVFFEVNNANISHRSLHVTLVSRVARQVGRILELNTDLIEAVALGHDIGHPPYGHLGEDILKDITKKYGFGTFMHNAQGVRWLLYLEKRFPTKPANGLNLTLQVIDGILCHDGEVNEKRLKPEKINGKSWDRHFKEYKDCFQENKIEKIPMSYEGIVVRFCDTIAYIGRDIEDAILLNYINRSDIPENCKEILGNTNRKIMNTLIKDLLNFSFENNKGYIGYSDEIFEALKELKKFNYNKIYKRRDLLIKDNSDKTFIDRKREEFNSMFKVFLEDLENENHDSTIFQDHINYIDDKDYSIYFKNYKEQDKLCWIVRDYIAGMSDRYFKDISESVQRTK